MTTVTRDDVTTVIRTPVADDLRRAVAWWLGSVCALIVLMVAVGGITRLTGSGLSIVDWKPLVGAIPPLTDRDWDEAFQRYQEFPQYKVLADGMTLAAFKRIFFWEYVHRLIGRLIGIVFVVPWAYFAARRAFAPSMSIRLLGALGLGGLQGALGWFMVKSGLVDVPHVSHYRLAAHLSLALLVLGYVFWLLLDVRAIRSEAPASRRLRAALRVVLVLLAAQIVYGALTAGLHAGIGYNTFPTMQGYWVPPETLALRPAWLNVVENRTTVQLVHRVLGTLLFASIATVWAIVRFRPIEAPLRRSIHLLLAVVAAQFALGVATLVLVVPIVLAVAHQLGACVLFLVVVRANHAARSTRRQSTG